MGKLYASNFTRLVLGTNQTMLVLKRQISRLGANLGFFVFRLFSFQCTACDHSATAPPMIVVVPFETIFLRIDVHEPRSVVIESEINFGGNRILGK